MEVATSGPYRSPADSLGQDVAYSYIGTTLIDRPISHAPCMREGIESGRGRAMSQRSIASAKYVMT